MIFNYITTFLYGNVIILKHLPIILKLERAILCINIFMHRYFSLLDYFIILEVKLVNWKVWTFLSPFFLSLFSDSLYLR